MIICVALIYCTCTLYIEVSVVQNVDSMVMILTKIQFSTLDKLLHVMVWFYDILHYATRKEFFYYGADQKRVFL